ncbi:MAG: glycosyltransferase family 1 protein [Chloroflexi bacterium]|nr:glycosyltransferase family 1 protein [Chloroflexota bacterium]
MASFWFTSAPLPGHLDWGGLLKTAQALQARGHAVRWVSEARIAPFVQAAGVPFSAIEHSGWRWPPPPPLPASPMGMTGDPVVMRYQRALDTWLDSVLVPRGVQALLALAEDTGRPDAIVTDPFLSAAALAAEALDVPLVVGGWPGGPPLDDDQLAYAQQPVGRVGMARLESLCEQFGVRGTNFGGGAAPSVVSPHLHISYFSPYWYQGESYMPQTEFVGGQASAPNGRTPDWLDAIPPDQPVGMVTLGSTFTSDHNFLVWGARALADNGFVPLVVMGRTPTSPEQKALLKSRLPGGTRLLSWIDYDHVFPRLRVVIHHGGMGTTHAAILHALPQIITPHAADQRGQARRARQAKVGLELHAREIHQGQLAAAVGAITSTPLVDKAVRSLQESFAALGGPARAAELIEHLTEQLEPGG